MVSLIAYKEGIDSAAVGLVLIVMLDATSLRRQVGKQATTINSLIKLTNFDAPILGERTGYSRLAILTGAILGMAIGALIGYFS